MRAREVARPGKEVFETSRVSCKVFYLIYNTGASSVLPDSLLRRFATEIHLLCYNRPRADLARTTSRDDHNGFQSMCVRLEDEAVMVLSSARGGSAWGWARTVSSLSCTYDWWSSTSPVSSSHKSKRSCWL